MVGAMEIYMLLPKTNCKKCGLPTCMAFAVGLLGREKKIDECTPLIEEKKYEAKLKKLREVMAPIENASETGLIIHPEKCFGCGNCVVACPVNVAAEPTRCCGGSGPGERKGHLAGGRRSGGGQQPQRMPALRAEQDPLQCLHCDLSEQGHRVRLSE